MLRDLFSLFPAYAGVIPTKKAADGPRVSFPRIRGGDPLQSKDDAEIQKLFPAYAGVIPADNSSLVRPVYFSPHTRG